MVDVIPECDRRKAKVSEGGKVCNLDVPPPFHLTLSRTGDYYAVVMLPFEGIIENQEKDQLIINGSDDHAYL